MKILQHLMKQPFLTAVSIAAISHSTWSFAVMFTGLEPHPQFTWSWWAWVLPGAIMAFSIDIGLLSLAYQIRSGQRNFSKLSAFGVLSAAMCYAQFVYISSHMPSLTLAAGVRAEWSGVVQLFRDCSIWIFPALLPVALILYAFSDKDPDRPALETSPASTVVESDSDAVTVNFIRPEPHHDPALTSPETPALPEPQPVNSNETEIPIPVELPTPTTIPASMPTRERSISLRKRRTSDKHCAYCLSPLDPDSRAKYCNQSCRQLAYVARKAGK